MSGTILLADDSLTIQKVVELTFAETDFHVVAVSSGDELLDKLRSAQPDVIICDVIMPGRDGYEICQQIKSSPDWLHLPVILLTGTFEPFDRDRAIAAGCSEIITKPFEARKLVETVERLAGGSEPAMPDTGDVATPVPAADTDTGPVDTPPTTPDEDFGTQLSASESDQNGIEFTTSGFAEMEAAGQTPAEPVDGDDTGIEYDLEDQATAPESSADTAPDLAAQTVKIDTAALAEESDWDVPEAVDADEAEAEADKDRPESLAEPIVEPEDPAAPETEADEAVPEFTDEPSKADTSPVEPPQVDTPDATVAADGALGLSDEDVDRIARRVVELAADRLDQIAWEVVPDMAEIVVRQRIRELEAETEASPPEPVQ